MSIFKYFGFRFGKDHSDDNNTKTFVPPTNDDGSLQIQINNANVYYNMVYDLNGVINNEIDLINKYRDMSNSSIISSAVDEVVNDVVVTDQDESPVSLVIGERFKFSDRLKERIKNEFQNVLRLLNFQQNAYDIVRRWYIDGRMYYQVIVDETAPEKGIQELRYIDPRTIKKIREIVTRKNPKMFNADEIEIINEYYIYSKNGLFIKDAAQVQHGIKITKDSIIFCHSGLISVDNTMVLSYLHEAIKPYNNLRAMEDALVIYRITRAPERRVFNIDVGEMPPNKAKQYLEDIITNYRNKLAYNPSTGEIRDDRRHATIMEDFWFPRRSDRASSVETLAGGQNLSEISDVEYFEKKLYKSLKIPVTRLDPSTGFNIGRAAEITREEVKFAKFITRLRYKFSHIFYESLKRQLILKKITTESDWGHIKENIYFDFVSDSLYVELKKAEVLKERLDLLDQADQYVGKYFSKKYVDDNILRLTEEEKQDLENEKKQSEEGEAPAEAEKDTTDEGPDVGSPEDVAPLGSSSPEEPVIPETETTTPPPDEKSEDEPEIL
jgi:hypothetical protein